MQTTGWNEMLPVPNDTIRSIRSVIAKASFDFPGPSVGSPNARIPRSGFRGFRFGVVAGWGLRAAELRGVRVVGSRPGIGSAADVGYRQRKQDCKDDESHQDSFLFLSSCALDETNNGP